MDRKIVDYGLVDRADKTVFVNDVMYLIKQGYQPYGNPWSAWINEVEYFYQAMVKYE